jgi:hypothetical protein
MWGAMAGIVTGSAIAAGLIAGGVLPIPVHRDETDASADFVAAWERSRRGTFVVQSDFRRTLADGRTLYSVTELVQRPPDRITRQFGGIDGAVNGHPVVCSTDQNGAFRCFEGTQTVPRFDDQLQSEVDNLRSYFAAPRPAAPPLYRVIHAPDDGCFELFEQRAYPNAPYGRYARFCFDADTGAQRSFERRLEANVRETIDAVSINPTVVTSDFGLQQDPSFDQRLDLGAAPDVRPGDLTAGSTPLGAVPPMSEATPEAPGTTAGPAPPDPSTTATTATTATAAVTAAVTAVPRDVRLAR